MPNGLILMTALPPTIGHQHLIDFAVEYLRPLGGQLTVLLCSRDCEPLDGLGRALALRLHYAGNPRVTIVHRHADDPQNPPDHPQFYDYWRDMIRNETANQLGDIVFASERYGIDLATALGCTFVPCNTYRETVPISATAVRAELAKNFRYILPEYQPMLRKTVTVFGAESTGKSTLSKSLALHLDGWLLPEWAREYLEITGSAITAETMEIIARAQHAAQRSMQDKTGKPFIVQDTDLLSTIGYYRICGLPAPEWLDQAFTSTRSDLYLLMNSNIPFEVDPQRYGGDHRESTDKFWTDLLTEYGCTWAPIIATNKIMQMAEAVERCMSLFENAPLAAFVRAA